MLARRGGGCLHFDQPNILGLGFLKWSWLFGYAARSWDLLLPPLLAPIVPATAIAPASAAPFAMLAAGLSFACRWLCFRVVARIVVAIGDSRLFAEARNLSVPIRTEFVTLAATPAASAPATPTPTPAAILVIAAGGC